MKEFEPLETEARKYELMKRFRSAREFLVASITGLSDEEMQERAIDDQTISDILAHIVAWDRRSIRDARNLLKGQVISLGHLEEMDRFNAKALRRFRNASVSEVLDQLYRRSNDVYDFLEKADEEGLFRDRGLVFAGKKVTAAWILDYSEHDEEHANDILLFRERKQRGEPNDMWEIEDV